MYTKVVMFISPYMTIYYVLHVVLVFHLPLVFSAIIHLIVFNFATVLQLLLPFYSRHYCYSWYYCVTVGIAVLLLVLLYYSWYYCITVGITVLQLVLLYYSWYYCITGGITVLQLILLY